MANKLGFRYNWRHAVFHLPVFAALALISQIFNSLAGAPVVSLTAGYVVALLFARQTSALPLVIPGALTAGMISALAAVPFGQWPAQVSLALLDTVSTLTIALLCWWGYRKSAGQVHPLYSYTAFLQFLGTLTLSCFAATLPTLLHSRAGLDEAGTLVLQLWLAGFLGTLCVITPLLAQAGSAQGTARTTPLESGLWLSILVIVLTLVWYRPVAALFPLLLLPLMTWAATRFSLTGAMTSISTAGLGSLMATVIGLGEHREADLLLFSEALIAVMVAVACYIRVLLKDREKIESGLEHIVDERTRELQITNFELQDEIFVRQQAEKSFRRSSRHYRALFETASNPIIVVDGDITIRQWNSAAEALFGYSRDDAVGRILTEAFIPPEQQDEMAWKILKLLKSDLGRDSIETEVQSFDGTRHHILWNLNRLYEEEDRERHRLIMIGQDITEIRETQSQLHYLAHYDVLTDTANRRLFEDRCKQAITSALRYGHQCALIGLDVDHFKRINDTLGHDAGDRLLQELASRIDACIREEDTVARLGGDEFAVLLARVSGSDGCEKAARNILEAITRPIQMPSGELVITSSIGITIAPNDGRDYEQLLKNADMAMYRAKQAGRNNIQFFSAEMNEEMYRQLALEQELRAAIQNGELELHYQPVFHARTGMIQDVEALLRWNHPEKGLLTAPDFLDVAEQSGQLEQLTEWVCTTACRHATTFQDGGGSVVRVRINLSSRQYHHPRLADQLKKVLRETGLDPSLLLIEIDERSLSEHAGGAHKPLLRLKQLGVGLVLDRFGSGLSSLRLLRDLPFDQVKIDQELLRHAPHEESTRAIIHTLVNLARQLSLTVAAAGIETPEQDAFLRSTGCHLLQGHRFAPALPIHALDELLCRARNGEPMLPDVPFNIPFRGDSP